MRCMRCGADINSEAEWRFCTGCGFPVSQICPYEERESGKRVMLLDSDGRPTLSCPSCGGLYKYCGSCGRLHRLNDSRCMLPLCGSRLQEPSEPFPSADGPLNGCRSIRWNGSFKTQMVLLGAQTIDPCSHLAFRYGLLVAATGFNITILQWDADRWR